MPTQIDLSKKQGRAVAYGSPNVKTQSDTTTVEHTAYPGGPATLGNIPVRPEALRPRLSTGLPLSEN